MKENIVGEVEYTLGAIDPYETEFYHNVESSQERKTVSLFNSFAGKISNKVLVKDFGVLCKEINENTIEHDNTDNILKQLETLCVTCSVLYNQICYKYSLCISSMLSSLEHEKLFGLYMQKLFIEKRRQDTLWGPNQCHGYFWVGVLGEELGEFYEELEYVDRQVPHLNRFDTAITELIQVSAVCFSWWKEFKESKDSRDLTNVD